MTKSPILILVLLLFFGCSYKEKKVKLDDKSGVQEIILTPKPRSNYTTYQVRIIGTTDDSCKVFIRGIKPKILSGNIDFYESHDYYGHNDFIVRYEPYKSTKTNLEVTVSIQ